MRRVYRYLRSLARLVIDYAGDLWRFSVYNTSIKPEGCKRKLGAIIVRTAHGLEKAFSLPDVRLGFGSTNCHLLIERCNIYIIKYGVDDIVSNAVGVLNYYRQYHIKHSFELEVSLTEKIEVLSAVARHVKTDSVSWGGVKTVKKSDILGIVLSFDFAAFANARSSVRSFGPGVIPHSYLKTAVNIAMKSPSVCNRRAWRVNMYQGERLRKILEVQNGNRGFGHLLEQAVLIVGVLSSYSNQERNQVYIDGGLFAMSLIYALHSQGIGTCPLNTAFSLSSSQKFRRAAGLRRDEVPIMIVGFGWLKEKYAVTVSPRADPDAIIRLVE